VIRSGAFVAFGGELGDPVSVNVTGVEAPRGRVDLGLEPEGD
jgi:hypothetical protein